MCCQHWPLPLAALGRRTISFIFMQFSAKVLPSNRLAHQLRGPCPLPVGNPRSTTLYIHCTQESNSNSVLSPLATNHTHILHVWKQKWMSYPSTAHPDQQYPVLSSPFISETVNLSWILSRSLCVMCFTVLYPQLQITGTLCKFRFDLSDIVMAGWKRS